MTPTPLLRPEAQVDFEAAAFWYEDQRPGLGELFSAEVSDLIQRIAESPLRFPAVLPSVRRGLLHGFPYAVYFTVEEQEVVILAVLHQRRDPAVWKRRR
jgi:plasmid stabilization system protein ParE